jgi:hypothetical protein
MRRTDAATILRGLIPQGADLKRLPREGKDEITAAVDTVLRLAGREGQ